MSNIAVKADGQPMPSNGAVYVARMAVCGLVIAPDDIGDKVYGEIVGELEKDPRVDTIRSAESGSNTFYQVPLAGFESGDEGDYDAEEEGSDISDGCLVPDPASHIHTLSFRKPILMHIRAPKRLQEPFGDFNSIPSEEYWAAWDGLTLMVVWRILEDGRLRKVDERDIVRASSPAGGLIAQRVLSEAAANSGYRVQTLECSPNCNYTFSHADMLVSTAGPDIEILFSQELKDGNTVRVEVPAGHDPEYIAYMLLKRVDLASHAFAVIRCDSEAMQQAFFHASSDTASLLRLNYERALVVTTPFPMSLVLRWRQRRWKRDARRYIARIRLSLATIERLRSHSARYRGIYTRSAKDAGGIFDYEFGLSVESMSTVEIAEIRSSIENLTQSFDTNALVLATAIAAIVGAIVGAVVATLL